MTELSHIVALKVDVDTFSGTCNGVPRLLEILGRFGISATFYFSMGPDNSGKAIRRIFGKGFLRKMLLSGAPSAYDLRTMLYGILLPPPSIAERLPEILLSVEQAGHEAGIHCWDHVKWHDYLPWLPKQTALMELGRASAAFQEVFGQRARTTAAPGWTVTPDSLEIQDAMGLRYCSDARGTSPFYPVMDGRRFNTLQVPTTWPILDEMPGANGVTMATLNDQYLSLLKPGLNVHTIRAEMEGNACSETFVALLERLCTRGVRFVTLAEVADEYADTAPQCELQMGYIQGCVMPVAIQGGER